MHDELASGKRWPQAVPWSAAELVLGFLLVTWLWLPLAHEALRVSGFYRWFYGAWAAALVAGQGRQPVLGEAAGMLGSAALAAAEQRYRDTLARMLLWARMGAFPLQLVTYPVLFAWVSRARPEQLGLTTRRLGRSLLAGLLLLLALLPGILAVHWLVEMLYRQWSSESIQQHPLVVLASQGLTPVEWAVWVLNLAVVAPVVEELTFRGAVQPWLASHRYGGHLGMAGSLALALASRLGAIWDARLEGPATLADAAAPVLFVLALTPGYLVLWLRSSTPVGPGIFATSLLFACAHSSVWPTPIPLLVLSLGLGLLAYRTQSLAGPFLVHGLFNALNCLLLLLKP